jgi:hypothetical protein
LKNKKVINNVQGNLSRDLKKYVYFSKLSTNPLKIQDEEGVRISILSLKLVKLPIYIYIYKRDKNIQSTLFMKQYTSNLTILNLRI